MNLFDLVDFYKGNIKHQDFRSDVLDLSLGFTGNEVDNLINASSSGDDFKCFVENETWWMED